MENLIGNNIIIKRNIRQMKRSILYLMAVVCVMTSCIEENFKTPSLSKEGEVAFSAKLNSVTTRTLYDETQIANCSGSVKVNWVHNDLITVFGSACTGVRQAEYKVGTVVVDENNNPILDEKGNETPKSGQNYANYLNKTGAAGVQWGSATESDFYAIYPSTSNSFELTTNGAKVKTSIRSQQTNVFKKTTRNGKVVWVGTPYIDDQTNPSMPDALMYACSTGATPESSYVDLNFQPWSTVLKFKFEGISYGTGADNSTVTVTKIILTAPSNADIAGDLELEINKTNKTAEASPLGEVNNVITIYPNYLPLSADEKVEFCVYTIPQNDLYFGTEEQKDMWKVTIETAAHGNFTYNMRPSSSDKKEITLVAGKIHKINIPSKQITKPAELPPANWIEKIPRNVYLTELSVPGSWYSLNEAYQGEDITLDKLYSKGVRAFHFDCRLTMPSADEYTGTNEQNASLKLTVAGSEVGGNLGSLDYSSGTELETAMEQIATLTASKPKEFTVVVLTIAEKALSRSTNIYGTVDPSLVLPRIYSLLNTKKDDWNIYYKKTDIDVNGEQTTKYGIDSNTLIHDVLGHIVVKINVNTSDNNFPGYISNYEPHVALLSEGSMSTSNSGNITIGNFSSINSPYLYWGSNKIGKDDNDKDNPTMKYYYHQAQLTNDDMITSGYYDESVSSNTSGPKLSARINTINSIIGQAHSIYQSSSHNAWYQIAAGGTVKYERSVLGVDTSSEVHGRVAEVLNKNIIDQIDIKLSKEQPSPLGIVLMNYCIQEKTEETYYKRTLISGHKTKEYTTYGPSLIAKILQLNTLFYLKRDSTQPEWPDNENLQPSAVNAAYAVVGEDAF